MLLLKGVTLHGICFWSFVITDKKEISDDHTVILHVSMMSNNPFHLYGFNFIKKAKSFRGFLWQGKIHWKILLLCGELPVTWYWYGFRTSLSIRNSLVSNLHWKQSNDGFSLLCGPMPISQHLRVVLTAFFFCFIPRLLLQLHPPAAKSRPAGIIGLPVQYSYTWKLSLSHTHRQTEDARTVALTLCLASHAYIWENEERHENLPTYIF